MPRKGTPYTRTDVSVLRAAVKWYARKLADRVQTPSTLCVTIDEVDSLWLAAAAAPAEWISGVIADWKQRSYQQVTTKLTVFYRGNSVVDKYVQLARAGNELSRRQIEWREARTREEYDNSWSVKFVGAYDGSDCTP